MSEKGIYHRKKRPADVESVFGNIKGNYNFKRFMLRGKYKVEIEAGLLAIDHNFKKNGSIKVFLPLFNYPNPFITTLKSPLKQGLGEELLFLINPHKKRDRLKNHF